MILIIEIIKIFFVIGAILTLVPILVYCERKISAGIQDRIGPNRVGPFGLLQPFADAIKLIFKEDIIPLEADRFLYTCAPLLAFIPAALAFAVIPFGNKMAIGDYVINLQLTNINIGVMFILAVLGLGVYGIAFGGWASRNKYSLLGGLRASAQMIAYEITLGLSIIAIIMITGSVSMQEIVMNQASGFFGWNIFRQPLACLLFFVAALAENNRLPFDLAEAEAELVGGYHTEYSSMKFALFFMGEYVAMITLSAIVVTLFLGGWYFPGIVDVNDSSIFMGVLTMFVFGIKMACVLFTYIWIRWTLPRFKWTQLMNLGWKIFIPLSLLNIFITALIYV